MNYKKGQKILFYIKRYRCWMRGTIKEEAKFDKDLNCYCYSIKDLSNSNWAVQAGLVTDKEKPNMRIFNPTTLRFE